MKEQFGRQYWRSLEQLAGQPQVAALIEREFAVDDPQNAHNGVSRRRLLKILGASMALAGLTLSGCRRWPKQTLAPYTSSPPDRIPGVPEQYATVMELGGVAHGLLVSSFDGRPIKIEGNPTHPFSRTSTSGSGAADAYAQASVLELYDPDRSRDPVDRSGGEAKQSTWERAVYMLHGLAGQIRSSGGPGFAVLCEATSSPSVEDMRRRLMRVAPKASWYEYEAIGRDNEIAGMKLSGTGFQPVNQGHDHGQDAHATAADHGQDAHATAADHGQDAHATAADHGQDAHAIAADHGQDAHATLRPVLRLDRADVVVLLDADVLGTHPAHVRYAADWAQRRKSADEGKMSRVHIAESTYSITGAAADERLPVRASRMEALATALAAKLGVTGVASALGLSSEETKFIDRAAADLKRSPGAGMIAAGAHLPAELHALVLEMNQAIGAVGKTVVFVPERGADRPTHVEAIKSLVDAIKAGRVQTLLILGGNPAYDAPADVEFAAALSRVPMSMHVSLYNNETSLVCKWQLPRAHYLESWGDARAWDGTPSIQQPLIQPIYDGRSIVEVLAMILGDEVQDGYQVVRRTWQGMLPKGDFEKAFRRVLHEGMWANAVDFVIPRDTGGQAARGTIPTTSAGFEIRFVQSPGVYDGRFANNGWLQELPDALTKLTWDNAALISKKDADALGVVTGDVLKITAGGRSIEIVAYVMPGHPSGVIAIPLGYGRTAAGHVGNGVGFNAYALRTTSGMDVIQNASVARTGRKYELALTQDHHMIDAIGAAERARRVGAKGESSELIREMTLADYRRETPAETSEGGRRVSLDVFTPPSKFNDPHAWGMAIDMSACIGCNACVVACQAENNIPIVGKEQVRRGREMHWIRIDRYFKGAADDPNPQVAYQPMMCQQCEEAPCEQVCPVGATMHDSEGLNAMVYNRCIGTRYCSNNCPYKVRRFNYLDFHSQDPRGTPKPWLGMPDTQQDDTVDKIRRMVFNPEVTIRMRGVMEKCTYCVQRIHRTQTDKRNRGEDVKDGDIVTACQQACPTQAIVFGDLNDRESRVSRLHANKRSYSVLEELNTKPRTEYLAKIRNPANEKLT